MLRVYIGIALLILTVIPFSLLGIAQYQSYQKHKEIKQLKENAEKEKTIMSSPPPLPVCSKGEKTEQCRQLTANETGATVRGARDDSKDD